METKIILLVFLLLHIQISTVFSANILFFFGFSTYSHRIVAWPLVEKLTAQGHNVTFLSLIPNKNPDPRIAEIVPFYTEDEFAMPDFINMRLNYGRISVQVITLSLPIIGTDMCRIVVRDPKVMEWAKTSSYDIVVIDFLFNDCALGFAHKFKAKTVAFSTSAIPGHWPEAYRISAESNWIPDGCISFQMPLSFLERVITTLLPFYYYYSKTFYMYPRLESLLRDKLEIPDMPGLEQLDKKTELLLVNTHFSEELPRSSPPFVINIGGMHCKESTKPLPKGIFEFIEKAGEAGFIYISFGSSLQLGVAPIQIQDTFFRAVGNTNISFLWRWDHGPRPDGMPPNVHTEKWMPQQDILAHPKVRAFVTHGGLLGMQEAIYHAVPMIAFPVFAEQDYNAERLHRTARGIQLDIATVTQEKLENALKTILNDDRYKKNVKEASIRFKDRPSKPVDTALWWMEYILRHKDTTFMRPLESVNQFWFQRHLLDVWAFIFVVSLLILLLSIYTLKKLILAICCGKSRQTLRDKTTKPKPKKKTS